nr:methyltransferase-like protein [Tanacetum cinerariifolium]
MASNASDVVEQKPKIQIYSTPSNEVTPFWKEKYERDAKKYWDVFYKRHQDRFFKDRHYLDKEWGHFFSDAEEKVILEVGCGAGNTIFPLAATYPGIYIHACDFSPRAVDLVKAHKDFQESKINAFPCDITTDDLLNHVPPSSVDIVTMIFVLSAVSPEKMHLAMQNIKKILKPNGYVLFRDYATGDLAQERLTCKDQKISENFFVRGDGTRAFYFSEEFLKSLFQENGFTTEECGVCCKQVENRSREIVMNRRWVQAAFRLDGGNGEIPKITKEAEDGYDIDISDGFTYEMFGISSPMDEIMEFKLRDWNFKIKLLSKEFQHTCKSTGLMLWESARLMASVLASNQAIVSEKKVLELGSGCGGICSMIATKTAHLMVPTDGDDKALELLHKNVATNLEESSLSKLHVKKLFWGDKEHIESVKKLSGNKGFDVIIGTDVTYVAEYIMPLFQTANELISKDEGDELGSRPALILCHIFRRVDEASMLSAASHFGFQLVDRWPNSMNTENTSQSIINSWFEGRNKEDDYENPALNIMYFHYKGKIGGRANLHRNFIQYVGINIEAYESSTLMRKMKIKDVGVKNSILTSRGDKKRRHHQIGEIKKKNLDNICEENIMAIRKG